MKLLSILGNIVSGVWNILTFAFKWGTIVLTALFFISIFYLENVQNAINFFKNIF